MSLIDQCEKYMKYMTKLGYDEKDLENCIRFHLFDEIRKRVKFDEKFLKLIELMKDSGSINCPRGYENSNLCECSDILLSYERVVFSKFEKEIIQNKDFSNFEMIHHYFFEKFGIEMFKIEEIFKSITTEEFP